MEKDYEMDDYWKEQERFNREYWKQGENKDDGYWDGHHAHKDMEYWNDETNGLKHDHVLKKDREACEAHHDEEEKDFLEQKTKEERFLEYKREKAERLAAEQNIQNRQPAQNPQNRQPVQNYQGNEKKPEVPFANEPSLRNVFEPSKKKEKPQGFFKNPIILFWGSIISLFMAINYISENSFGGSFFCAILSGVIMVNSLRAKENGKRMLCILSFFIGLMTLIVTIIVLPDMAYTYDY